MICLAADPRAGVRHALGSFQIGSNFRIGSGLLGPLSPPPGSGPFAHGNFGPWYRCCQRSGIQAFLAVSGRESFFQQAVEPERAAR